MSAMWLPPVFTMLVPAQRELLFGVVEARRVVYSAIHARSYMNLTKLVALGLIAVAYEKALVGRFRREERVIVRTVVTPTILGAALCDEVIRLVRRRATDEIWKGMHA